MPESPKSQKNESAGEFIQSEIDRARNNLQNAIHQAGHNAARAANPIPWLKRYPLKCGIATGLLVAGGAAAALLAWKRKSKNTGVSSGVAPVNVYVKKPRPQSGGWSKVATALLAAVGSQVVESLKTTIASSISADSGPQTRNKTVIVPNPQLRDFQI